MANVPSNKVEPHGTSVAHSDGGTGASGNFIADHKKAFIIGGVAIAGLVVAYLVTRSSGTPASSAANQGTGTASGAQDAGTATALNDLQTQFNALQQLLAGNGTVGSTGICDLSTGPNSCTPQPTPGGPGKQIMCIAGYTRDANGNCTQNVVPCPSGSTLVGGVCVPNPKKMCPAGTTGIWPACVPVKVVSPCTNGIMVLGVCIPFPSGFKLPASGMSGFESGNKAYFFNNGSLQGVGLLGSTSDLSKAKAPAGWKPAASGISGYESSGYDVFYNNGKVQSVIKQGARI